MTTWNWFGGKLVDLTAEECATLLHEGAAVGRLGLVDDDGPVIVPVNFRWHHGRVTFRTRAGSLVARVLAARPACAFEVDGIDDYTRSGWSVLVRGAAEEVDPTQAVRDDDAPETWSEGPHAMVFAITPREITGRRVLPS